MGLKIRSTKKWRTVAVVSGILLSLTIVGGSWADNYSSIVTSAIGGQTSKTIKNEDNNENTMRYPTNGQSLEEWKKTEENLIRKVQAEGSVLLKNNGVLPLKTGAKVSTFGYHTVKSISTGLVQFGTAGTYVDFKTGMEENGKLQINPTLYSYFEGKSTAKEKLRENHEVAIDDIATVQSSYANYNDAAIVVIGRAGGEGNDLDYDMALSGATGRTGGRPYLQISEKEEKILEEVKNHFENIIVLIDGSYAIELSFLEKYNVDACLFIGAIGYSGFYAVSDILTGVTNPSGRLVDTFATNSLSAPAMTNFGNFTYANSSAITAAVGNANNSKYLVEKEGIYVGYKYYETRYEDSILGQGSASGTAGATVKTNWNYDDEVIYPFGYGISYTTFDYALSNVRDAGKNFEVNVRVTNSGSKAGREVVQVYAQTPYTDFDKQNNIEVASVQLAGFGKTKLLNAGESQILTIRVKKEDLAHYDSFVNKTYIMEAGQYYLTAAKNAHDAINNILAKKGKNVNGNANLVYDGFKPNRTDTETYAVSDSNVIITNRFDDIDLNYWMPGAVTYLSRKDWQGTWPTTVSTLNANEKMINALKASVGYEAGDGDLSKFTIGADTEYAVAMMIGLPFDHESWDLILNQMSVEDIATLVVGSGINAVESISYPGNFSKDGSHRVTDRQYLDPADLENPNVKTSTTGQGFAYIFPSAVIQACTFDRDLLLEIGRAYGEDNIRTKTVGHYCPSVNIHRTPYSGRNFEYYSEDGYLNGELSVPAIQGMQEKGANPYLKHFAFNDQETNRSGVSTFMSQQAAREIYLEAFKAGVVEGKTKGLMGGFNRVGCTWTGAHKGLLINVLREEWGSLATMDTDAGGANLTGYMNFAAGLDGGTTMWASSSKPSQAIIDAIKADSKLYENARNAAHILLFNQINTLGFNGISAADKIVPVTPYWAVIIICLEVAFGLLTAGSIALTVIGDLKEKED